jgi:hypothetical protein
VIPPEQAWFGSEGWQPMEGEAQADLAAGRVTEAKRADLSRALKRPDRRAKDADAEGQVHPALFEEFCRTAGPSRKKRMGVSTALMYSFGGRYGVFYAL